MLQNNSEDTSYDPVNQKQDYFRNSIRQQQISSYKNILRFELLINYSDPSLTLRRIQNALFQALLSNSPTTIPNKLIEIIDICRRLKNDYQHCALLANHKILQNILVAIVEFTHSEKAVAQWLKLVIDTMQSWSDLWFCLHQELPTILSAILSDFSTIDEIVELCTQILQHIKIKYEKSLNLTSQQIIQMLSNQHLSPLLLPLISNNLTRQTQEQVQTHPVLPRLLSLLHDNRYSRYIVRFLERICFVNRGVLDGLKEYLAQKGKEQIGEEWDEDICGVLKILYQQTQYTSQQLEELGEKYKKYRKYIEYILDNDN